MRTLRLLAAYGLVAIVAACASGKRSEPGPIPPPTTLAVENRAFNDMNIYVLRSSQRIRLGTVTGNSTRTFVIPSNLIFGATPLRFLADPVGSQRTPVSDEITVSPGDNVKLVIPPA